jgi:tetratricopeptide (TPR) repeat protein
MFPTNPYIVGNPVGNTHVFVGRNDILEEVWRIVVHDAEENAIVLYGQRRIGKTSVLQELEARLPKEGLQPIFFDLQNKAEWPLGRVLKELADKISALLAVPPPDLGDEPESTFRDVWLPEILKLLHTSTSLVLLLDEFDVLANPESEQAGAAFFPYLHNLLNTNPIHLNCVFAIGRNIDDLSTIALSLFKDIPAKLVSLLSHTETVKLVHLSQNNETLNWSNDEAVEKIWQLTNGHPFLTQALCSHIWERLHNQNPTFCPTVTLTDVEEAIPDTLSSRRNTLEWLWDGLPPAERVVASILASVEAKVITEIQLEELLRKSGVQLIIRELQNAPRLLQEWDLIEMVDQGYRFRVELLRRWIAEYKKPQQAQLALDHLDPAADILYQAAQKLYRHHHLTEAIGPLRQAIGLNANHVAANLLLADILLKRKQAKEACEILERLYTIRPIAAQMPLIQGLLALALSNENEEEQLKRFERILEIDPNHLEAKRQKQAIIKRREEKKQQQIKRIKTIYEKHSKLMWDFLGVIFALLISYYWLTDRIPTGPVIVLEVERLNNELAKYAIKGVISDQPYALEKVKIIPHSAHSVKKARFKYHNYIQAVDLIIHRNTEPPTYSIDKSALQRTLAATDKHFRFEFLTQEPFTFSFEFEVSETRPVEFECQVFTTDNQKVPCQVREKGYLSLFRGIPWFASGALLGIILIILIEIKYAFKKRKSSYQQY